MVGVISMDVNKKIKNKINELDDGFVNLIKDDKLDINSIEDLAMKTIEDVNSIINTHIEELVSKKLNEKELISKKNRTGKKKDSN